MENKQPENNKQPKKISNLRKIKQSVGQTLKAMFYLEKRAKNYKLKIEL
jgi:hypothetical protein